MYNFLLQTSWQTTSKHTQNINKLNLLADIFVNILVYMWCLKDGYIEMSMVRDQKRNIVF